MAKALLGHVGMSADPRLIDEVCRLRMRVTELAAEVARMRAINEALVVNVEDDIRLLTKEPALT